MRLTELARLEADVKAFIVQELPHAGNITQSTHSPAFQSLGRI